MATRRYVCRKCNTVRDFDTRRKNIICPVCKSDISLSWLGKWEVVGGTLYKGEYLATDRILEIPKGCKWIESRAFEDNFTIQEIRFPKTLKSISTGSFRKNYRLKKLFIPGSVESIGSYAFEDCRYLEEVIISEGVETIWMSAFADCAGLKRVVLPKSLKKIYSGAFEKCPLIEELVIPEGVTEIEERAFYKCKGLKFISLPSTLRKIGKCAFNTFCDYLDFYQFQASPSLIKKVVLPSGIEEISDDAFEDLNKDAKNSHHINYVIGQKSPLKSKLEENGVDYAINDTATGYAVGEEIINETLYYLENASKKETIPDVKVVAECAFLNCDEIKEITFPESVREIKSCAFKNCTSLTTITFDGVSELKTIAPEAFENIKGTLVDLPSSIEHFSNDAFSQNCIVSVGGDMPFYNFELAELNSLKNEIEEERKRLSALESILHTAHKELQEHENSFPSETNKIPELKALVSDIEKDRDKDKEIYLKEIEILNERIGSVESQIKSLITERNNCFFLAFSKKKELDGSVENKRNELKVLNNKLAEAKKNCESIQAYFASRIEPIQKRIGVLDIMLSKWRYRETNLTEAKSNAEENVSIIKERILICDNELNNKTESLETKHTNWIKARNDEILRIKKQKIEEEERERIENLKNEKNEILSIIGAPIIELIMDFSFGSRTAVVEESLLNEAFHAMISLLNNYNEVQSHNTFVATNRENINRIKMINNMLHLTENDGIEHLDFKDLPHIPQSHLPLRFKKLAQMFSAYDQWEHFKRAISGAFQQGIRDEESYLRGRFFDGSDYYIISYNKVSLLVFPYCMVLYEPTTFGMELNDSSLSFRVLTYDEVKVRIYCYEEEITDAVDEFGEILCERHKYLNKDGSVSRRYKENPIVKIVRYTTLAISSAKDRFEFPVKTHQIAVEIEAGLKDYCQFITTNLMENAYRLVTNSAEIEEIITAINKAAEEEALRLEAKARSEVEEKQRFEEERKAMAEAAEIKRQAAIQRQRELNEERRRLAEEKKKVVQLFEDDFSAETKTDIEERPEVNEAWFCVESNMTITNNVFKIVTKQVAPLTPKEFTVYFASEEGNIISNKKRIITGNIGDETTLGFVLNSGIDYTKMKRCFMKISASNDESQNIEFKMNIAFYSDF